MRSDDKTEFLQPFTRQEQINRIAGFCLSHKLLFIQDFAHLPVIREVISTILDEERQYGLVITVQPYFDRLKDAGIVNLRKIESPIELKPLGWFSHLIIVLSEIIIFEWTTQSTLAEFLKKWFHYRKSHSWIFIIEGMKPSKLKHFMVQQKMVIEKTEKKRIGG